MFDKFPSKEKKKSKLHESLDLNTPFTIALLNVNGLTPDDWENLKQYLEDRNTKVDAYILTEHHLDSTETLSYITNDNYTMHITLGPKQKGNKQNSQGRAVYNGGVALLVKADTFEITL